MPTRTRSNAWLLPLGRVLFTAIVLLGLVGCGGKSTPAPTPPGSGHSQQVATYLDQLIGYMQANALNRLSIDWTAFRANVLARAAGAQTIADTFPAIKYALEQLGDGHSVYRAVSGTVISVSTGTCTAPSAGTPALPEKIGYVKVPSFSGSGVDAINFAAGLQRTIRLADRDDLLGWIVDVRGNGGGNMWPMVAGVGPVAGDSVLGYFVDGAGAESRWEYRSGAAWLGDTLIHQVTAAYAIKQRAPRVAVLTDGGIASSGEAIVISFKGRPDTRSFGDATCGMPLAGQRFNMSDGAGLDLIVAAMADRTHARYVSPVPPDELVADPAEAVSRAVAWLRAAH